jgi:phosphatidylserine/phosphatidylglycerophosphate/cardiolipin synthase-like enzyme
MSLLRQAKGNPMNWKQGFFACILCFCGGMGGMYLLQHPKVVSHASRSIGNIRVRTYFSPKGGCTAACVEQIGLAQKTILVQAYSFTSEKIVAALIDAHKRGVNVRIILDKSDVNGVGSKAKEVADAGIEVMIDHKHAIAHNKIMIIDDKVVTTGSFNFTDAAENSNAENYDILDAPDDPSFDLPATFTANWNLHYAHSVPYKGAP